MNTKSNSEYSFKERTSRKSSAAKEIFAEHGKVPPQAIDLEEAVLGAMMLEKDAVAAVIELLTPEVFYKEGHQAIFEAIFYLFNSNQPVDVLTVTNELRKMGKLEIAGGAYYVTQLTARIASSANIEYHVGIIKQKHLQRELIRISTDTIKKSFEETSDVFDLLDETERGLFEISEVNLRRKAQSMPQIVQNVITHISNIRSNEDAVTGVKTGFDVLDNITGGWQPSDLIVIAARPGMGKTSFVLTMARNMAINYNNAIAFFSLEMTANQLVSRLIASESEVNINKLMKGDIADHEWEQINSRINVLEKASIFIDDSPGLSLFELRAKCRRLKAQHDIKAVVVDYIQLMTDGTVKKGGGNREQEIAAISRSLKGLAKELNIPVIALSQLNRSVETRGGKNESKKPVLSDLRESGAIEQDADLVCFIYRPEYYQILEDENGDTRGKAMISIAKHRNGKTDDVWLRFVNQFARFENLPRALSYDEEVHLNPNTGFESNPKSMVFQSKINEMTHDNDLPQDMNLPEEPDF